MRAVVPYLKLPSTPDTSMALIIILVSLNGTCHRNPFPQQAFKPLLKH